MLTVLAQRTKSDADCEEPESIIHPEVERDKSRVYLSKCFQEIAYHVIPTSHPTPEFTDLEMSNHLMDNQQIHQSFEDAYVQGPKLQHDRLDNHQPYMNSSDRVDLNSQASRGTSYNSQQQPMSENGSSLFDQEGSNEQFVYSKQPLDPYRYKENYRQPSEQAMGEESSEDIDGWNFDEPSTQEQALDSGPPHRPDTDAFPNANFTRSMSPTKAHHRKESLSRRRSEQTKQDMIFRVRFALRGHLDVVRSVIFTGGGSPSEPEICTCSDDGTIKRWIIPATYGGANSNSTNDLDITSYFTHRGHVGAVTALAACSHSQNFLNGGRALGDGWVFSGGQDASVKVWERGRVDAKATLDGHTDAVWGLSVLPGTSASIFGEASSNYGGSERVILASGAADGKVLIWAVSAPPQVSTAPAGSRRAGGSRRANSISSGSNFPSSPQPSTATSTPFHYALIHQIVRPELPSPTCICPLSPAGINFVVSYVDASVIVYDTKTGEESVSMASLETYDGTPSTGVNSVVATTTGFDGTVNLEPEQKTVAEEEVHGATGSSVEGVIIGGYEDRFIRFFDANSGTL